MRSEYNLKKLVGLALAGLLLTACGQKEDKKEEASKVEPVKVELTVPEKAKANEKVTLEAKVTMGDKAVNDADEVEFEVANTTTKDPSDMIKVEESKDGVYKTEYTFKKDGEYKVTSHVTAHDQHTMPTKEVMVGNITAHEHGKKEHSHDHHDGGIHIMDITAEKDKEAMLMIHVTDENGKAYKNAHTRFEVKTPSGKIEWIDLKETKDGQYEAIHTFNEVGTYQAKAHAEGHDDFHVHQETTFEIK